MSCDKEYRGPSDVTAAVLRACHLAPVGDFEGDLVVGRRPPLNRFERRKLAALRRRAKAR
jgi:hypothetical protein